MTNLSHLFEQAYRELRPRTPMPEFEVRFYRFAKLHRKPVDTAHPARYRKYIGSHAMAQKSQLIRQLRGRKRIADPKGRHYDLDQIFDDLNSRFFHGLMARPQMTWSGNKALRMLGHYDPADRKS